MNRRMFLRSAGATLWLPFLPSALPREARAAASEAPRRMVFFFVPNGLMADAVTPTTIGASYDLPPALSAVAPIQSRVTVVSGIENRASDASFGTHEACVATLLTDKPLGGSAYTGPLDGGISVDQVAAKQFGSITPFNSLQLGTGEASLGGGGNLEVYYEHISWAGPQTPLAALTKPKTVFDRLFAGIDPTATAEEIERRTRLRTSVLDAVLERANALDGRLGAEDRAKLDQFATGVRDLEVRIQQLSEFQCPAPEAPPDVLAFPALVDAMTDLVAVALQCDSTRVVTFMLGPTTAVTSYAFLGPTRDHHSLSHEWSYDDEARADMLQIQTWQVGQWVALCEKLAAVPEGDGDLLSNTLAVLVTEFSDSNRHVSVPMNVLLAGGEAGGVLQGRHRVYPGRPHVDLWHSALEFVGVDPTGFGTNATGPIDLSAEV